MTNKEKIVECLEKEYPNTLSSSEISKKVGIQIDMIYIYLNDLNRKKRIVRVNNKKPYQYKADTYKVIKGDFEKLKNITKELLLGENISDKKERWLVEICQL